MSLHVAQCPCTPFPHCGRSLGRRLRGRTRSRGMGAPNWLWCAALAASVCGSGCATSPWNVASATANAATGTAVAASPPGTAAAPPTTATAPPSATAAPATPATVAGAPGTVQQAADTARNSPAAATSPAASARPDPRVVEDLVAQIAKHNALDPAATARLTQDLLQMDQAWCLAMSRVFQANLAFQRQNAERERRAAAGENQVSASSADSTSSAAPMPNGSSGADLSTSRNSPTVGAQEAAAERTAAQTIPPAPKLSQTPELLPKDSQTSAGEATITIVDDRPTPKSTHS